mmetsp:Transcript_121352/g.387902  ORF Transcript_121352/g.387902 Transcript_121352/m.387902 type:complete len:215 (-) Transcript_121352:2316-2960(-)
MHTTDRLKIHKNIGCKLSQPLSRLQEQAWPRTVAPVRAWKVSSTGNMTTARDCSGRKARRRNTCKSSELSIQRHRQARKRPKELCARYGPSSPAHFLYSRRILGQAAQHLNTLRLPRGVGAGLEVDGPQQLKHLHACGLLRQCAQSQLHAIAAFAPKRTAAFAARLHQQQIVHRLDGLPDLLAHLAHPLAYKCSNHELGLCLRHRCWNSTARRL